MKIKSEIFEIRGSHPIELNPLPKFKDRFPTTPEHSTRFPTHLKETLGCQYRTLPYMVQDRYSRSRELLKLKSFVLENKYPKARFHLNSKAWDTCPPDPAIDFRMSFDKTLKYRV